MTARGHFPTDQAALKCLYLVTRGLDPGLGQARWITRWKPALNAFAVNFADRMPLNKRIAGCGEGATATELRAARAGLRPKRAPSRQARGTCRDGSFLTWDCMYFGASGPVGWCFSAVGDGPQIGCEHQNATRVTHMAEWFHSLDETQLRPRAARPS